MKSHSSPFNHHKIPLNPIKSYFPLVICYSLLSKLAMGIMGFPVTKWWFSIVMLNWRRVSSTDENWNDSWRYCQKISHYLISIVGPCSYVTWFQKPIQPCSRIINTKLNSTYQRDLNLVLYHESARHFHCITIFLLSITFFLPSGNLI